MGSSGGVAAGGYCDGHLKKTVVVVAPQMVAPVGVVCGLRSAVVCGLHCFAVGLLLLSYFELSLSLSLSVTASSSFFCWFSVFLALEERERVMSESETETVLDMRMRR